ncbi:MAG: ribosome maturation factor RimM [Raineya sp.]|nr:ribosome maturation factor RimM [Raineya sp.]MDW8297376.1 ribosome maturation factor RimM [Raineya sp.]
MTRDECFELGKILKTHALYGEVSVFLDVDYPEDYENLQEVWVEIEEVLQRFEVEQVRLLPNKPQTALLKLKSIDSIEQAQEIVGFKLFLPLSFLPELGEKQFYFHEIIGFLVVDKNLGELAQVRDVYTTSQTALLAIDYKNKEVLIPINDEVILQVDRKNQKLHVELPNGLLEVYL